MLEVIATSVMDAVNAEAGGADRIELIADFAVGGLTPPLDLVRDVADAVPIPVRVMLRATENFNVTDEAEKLQLCATAKKLAALPLDGIVCGFLQNDTIDHELLQRVLDAAHPLKATFHRAFEELSAPLAAIYELKKYPQIDCILTSGGQGTRAQKIICLSDCAQIAPPEIMILAGGGMTDEMLRAICAQTQIRDFHLGTFVREPQEIHGVVNVARVQEITALIQRNS